MFRVMGLVLAGGMATTSAVTLRVGLPEGFGRTLAERLDFAEVVEIEVNGSRGGSGVVIDENWVLTAGHVVEGGRSMVVSKPGWSREVSEVITHPDWSANPAVGVSQGADLALLRIAQGLSEVPVVPLWGGGNSVRPLAMIAGYGAGGNGLLGAYQPGDGLQAGLNLVDRFVTAGSGAFWITDFDSGASRHNSLNRATVDQRYFDLAGQAPLTELVFANGEETSRAGFAGLSDGFGPVFPEATTARGDSGGPLFLFNEARQRWELAGITSFGLNPLYPPGFQRGDSRYGDLSFFTDVSGQRDWLTSVVIPEISTSVLMMASGLWWAVLRRR